MKRIVLSLFVGCGIYLGFLSGSTLAGPAPALDCATAVNINVPVSECQALMDLYSSTNGSRWNVNKGRNTDTSVCTWNGVSCKTGKEGSQYRVSGLSLKGIGLNGELPDSLSALDQILSFDVSSNQLIGDLPSSLSTWTNITEFNAPSNKIGGTLPVEWSTWMNIKTFNIGKNQIVGTLPTEWSNWMNLNYFIVGGNQIVGTLPVEWSTWINLSYFNASQNQIVGTLPTEWSTWINMSDFSISNNQIEGALPVEWSSWTNLQNFNAAYNQIGGILPTEWSSWINIYGFSVNNNQIVGTLPTEWSTWTAMEGFNVSTNNIIGALPNAWVDSRTDRGYNYIDVTNNCLVFDSKPTVWIDTNVSYNPQNICDDVDLFINQTLLNIKTFSPGNLIGYAIDYGNFGPFTSTNFVIKVTPGHGLSITEASLPYTTEISGFGESGDICFDNLVSNTSGPYVDVLNERAATSTRMQVPDMQTLLEQEGVWSGGANRGPFLIDLIQNQRQESFKDFMMNQLGLDITMVRGCGQPGKYNYVFNFKLGLIAGSTGQIILTGNVDMSGFDPEQNTISNIATISTTNNDIDTTNNNSEIFARLFIPVDISKPTFAGGGKGTPTTVVNNGNTSNSTGTQTPGDTITVPATETPSQTNNDNITPSNPKCLFDDANYDITKMQDIPKGGLLRTATMDLVKNCIVQGQYNQGLKFGIYDKITYGEVYKIIVRSLNIAFNIDNKGHRALPYKVSARQSGLLEGTNLDTTFDSVADKNDVIKILNNVAKYKGISKVFTLDDIKTLSVLRGRFAVLLYSLLQ